MKLALLASGRELRDLFPEFVAPATNEEINQALASDAPLEVVTTVDADEALRLISQMESIESLLTAADIENAEIDNSDDW